MLKKTVIPANVSGGERGIYAGPGSLPSGRLMNIKGMEKQEQTGIRRVWHALQTWHCREQQVESYLQSHGLSPFLPRLLPPSVLCPEPRKIWRTFREGRPLSAVWWKN